MQTEIGCLVLRDVVEGISISLGGELGPLFVPRISENGEVRTGRRIHP